MTLTEFLLARIAEDEATATGAGSQAWHVECHARDADWLDADERAEHLASPSHQDECTIVGPDVHIYDEGGHSPEQAQHIAHFDPARVLAECEAKRLIMGASRDNTQAWRDELGNARFGANGDPFLYALALPYADHPDFRPEWKP